MKNNKKYYYVVSRVQDNEFTEGRFEYLTAAINCARAEWGKLTEREKDTHEIEVRQYEEDIEKEGCKNFDYDTFEWILWEEEIEAAKKVLEYCDYNPEDWKEQYENETVAIVTGYDGEAYAWLWDGRQNVAVKVETGEIITDEETIERLLY